MSSKMKNFRLVLYYWIWFSFIVHKEVNCITPGCRWHMTISNLYLYTLTPLTHQNNLSLASLSPWASLLRDTMLLTGNRVYVCPELGTQTNPHLAALRSWGIYTLMCYWACYGSESQWWIFFVVPNSLNGFCGHQSWYSTWQDRVMVLWRIILSASMTSCLENV